MIKSPTLLMMLCSRAISTAIATLYFRRNPEGSNEVEPIHCCICNERVVIAIAFAFHHPQHCVRHADTRRRAAKSPVCAAISVAKRLVKAPKPTTIVRFTAQLEQWGGGLLYHAGLDSPLGGVLCPGRVSLFLFCKAIDTIDTRNTPVVYY